MRPSVENGGFYNAIQSFEGGNVPFMYQDNLGLVTAGTGNLLEDQKTHQPTEECLSLAWRHKGNGALATREEIRAAWNEVKSHPELNQKGGMIYENITDLRLDKEAMNKLFLNRLRSNDVYLTKRYPAFQSWPADGQIGAHSIAWAQGAFGKAFEIPAFKDALTRVLPDFAQAAVASHCQGCTVKRNQAIATLFSNADMVLKGHKDPEVVYYPQALAQFNPSIPSTVSVPSKGGTMVAWAIGITAAVSVANLVLNHRIARNRGHI